MFWRSLAALALVLGACSDDPGRRPLGAVCSDDAQCVSGLCLGGQCLDPQGDEDLDGVLNGVEGSIGSNPFDPDTDGDGTGDREELATDFAADDTDGDGFSDVLESAVADADGDCITDQYDAQNAVPDSDPSPMIPAVCRLAGVCADQQASLAVTCDAAGVASCVYDGVVGFADPEVACDGRDEDCDGQADEGFTAAQCAPAVRPWLAPGNGTYQTGSTRYRASIGFGPVPARTATSSRYRVEIGFSPSLLSTEAP